MGGLSAAHWAVIALAFILLFGYKKLPDASRSIGRSLRIFKAETKGLRSDDAAAHAEAPPAVPTPIAAAPAPPAAPVPPAPPAPALRDDEASPLPGRIPGS